MITEEMIEKAYLAFWAQDDKSNVSPLRAALAAVAPMILEEAAKVADQDDESGRYIASAIRALATHSGDGEGK